MDKAIGPWYLCRSENDARHWDIRLSPETGWRGDEYMSLSGFASEERARVAAAAPELLEALETIIGDIERAPKRFTWQEKVFQARAAIAKATGSQS